MSLLSAAQNFLPLRGADRMAPCGAGNLFDGEARAQKWLDKCARAKSTRLVALIPKIKVRGVNAAGNTGAAGCRWVYRTNERTNERLHRTCNVHGVYTHI